MAVTPITTGIVLANSKQCENKCTKTLLKVRTDSTDSDRLDIVTHNVSVANGRYVNLITRYYWESRTTCYVEVGWEVWHIDSETGVPVRVTSLSDDTAFNEPNKITLKINGTSMSLGSNPKLVNTGHTMLDTDGTMIIPIQANSISPNVVARVEVSETTKYFPITFSYEYTDENDAGDIYYTVIFGEQKRDDVVRLDNTIKILKPSRYDNNVIFNKEGLKEFVDNIKKYPVIDINSTITQQGEPGIQITHGNSNKSKTITVGSNVKFYDDTSTTPNLINGDNSLPSPENGHIITKVNNEYFKVPVAGWDDLATQSNITAINNSITAINSTLTAINDIWKSGTTAQFLRGNGANNSPTWTNELGGDFLPTQDGQYNLGSASPAKRWQNLYLSGKVAIGGNADGTILSGTTYSKNTNASIYTHGGIAADLNIWGQKVFNAVFNDYAECRTTIDLAPGHVVIDNDDGSLSCSSARLQPGAQVISDTFGHLMGQTEDATTPIAVAGRVLVYTYQPRENYHAGMAVCSAPDGTVDIMTREEIRDYPDCIIGIVSEIPQYETWGTDNVKVDGRIWIKVK